MNCGADGIDQLAEAARKRTKLAETLVAIEKQQARMSLFAMEGTAPTLCQRFTHISQARELQLLNRYMCKNPVKAAESETAKSNTVLSQALHSGLIPGPYNHVVPLAPVSVSIHTGSVETAPPTHNLENILKS